MIIKLSRIIPTLLISCLILSCSAQYKTDLTAEEFEKGISKNDSVQVLDVRTPGEYKSGHISKALLADWNDKDEFNRRIGFIDKAKPVYVYCLSGGRSGAAASQMRKAGYQQVYELDGGINAWKGAGKNVEGRVAVKQMSLEDFNNSIDASKTVLVDFGAEWCPPCKLMEPVLADLQKNNPGKFTLLKVDGGNDDEIMQKFKVSALPVFIVFKDGKEVWRKDGVASSEELEEQVVRN